MSIVAYNTGSNIRHSNRLFTVQLRTCILCIPNIYALMRLLICNKGVMMGIVKG